MSKIEVLKINPDILCWARKESGYSIPEMVQKLEIEEERYIQWEKTGENIPFNLLESMAVIYKRQTAVFFLSEVPKKTKRPNDYRNLEANKSKLSPRTLLAIRRSNRYRDLLLELNGSNYYEKKYQWLSYFNDNFKNKPLTQESITNWIRQILSYSIEDQINDRTLENAYSNWRNSFERDLGIYIFQFGMPPSEIQGFCYSDANPYCIVVNNRYSTASRIFTLFHELGHILKKQSGLCIPNNYLEDLDFEFECNSFAGRVLLPENTITYTLSKDEIYTKAKRMKVSSEVYLRRLKGLELISDDEFFKLLKEIRLAAKPRKGFGVLTPIQKSLHSRGEALFNTVVDALNKRNISYEHASDILEVKINYLINV